jgi:receptor expression-enhancing protein 5/6
MIPVFIGRLVEASILLYAGLKSFKAIKSNDSNDDTQWLTFWLLYTIFEFGTTVTDLFAGYIIPFYVEMKIIFLLFIGVGGGANILFPVIEPYLLQAEAEADKRGIDKIVDNAAGAVREGISGALKRE